MGRHPVAVLLAAFVGLAVWGSVRANERVPEDRGLVKVDLDAADRVPGEPSVPMDDPEVALGQDNCEQIGSFQDDFSGTSRFRGNVYRIIGTDAVVEEIQMQLQFFGTNTLSFSIHERQGGTNEYVRIFVHTIQNVQGQGAPIFYSTGGVVAGTTLKAGRDYAIGVTWGATAQVVYGRNNQAQPTSFAGGQVLGLVNRNSIAPPLDAEVTLGITTTGAYSMRMCLQPAPGACCQNFNGTLKCGVVLEADCVEKGSFFHGQRTSCADSTCRFGACCTPCAEPGEENSECLPDYTVQACAALEGVHHRGRTCEQVGDQCEPVTGACCFGIEGLCQELCEADCIAQLGVYRGDGTICDPVFSPCRGACCVPEFGCINRSQQACLEFNQGSFRGNGTTCATLAPELQCGGACCFKQGAESQCVDGANASTRAACSIEQDVDDAIYIGDTLSCPMTEPPGCPADSDDVASCCLPNGACENRTESDCMNAGGMWNQAVPGACTESETCNGDGCCFLCPTFSPELDCPELADPEISACCLPSGACINTNEVECDKLAGAWNAAGDDCSPETACEVGACCFLDGTCQRLTEAGCEGAVLPGGYVGYGGSWAGAGTTCSVLTCNQTDIPKGACCDANGACTPRREAICDAVGGLYGGDNTSCVPNECIAFGACCRTDGSCFTKKTQAECEADGLGGFYLGDGSSCADASGNSKCDQRGACCTDRGRCLQVLEEECAALDGNPTFFAGASCSETTCGACCRVEGECEEVIQGKCPASADFTSNVGCSALDPECEPLNVCCLGELLCAELRESECLAMEGFLQGPVVDGVFDCSLAAVCQVGSCCVAGACEDTDRFRFRGSCELFSSSARFVPGALCDFDDPCAPIGGCCVGGTCQDEVSLPDCTGQGGSFLGAGVACGNESCGACCNDLQCRDTLPSLCVQPGDTFFAGTICDIDQPCSPSGACCVSGTCQTSRTASQCAAAGGVYLGDGSSCAGGTCLLGACCHRDGTCENGRVAVECTGDGDVYSRGFQCDQVSCQPKGACCTDGTCSLKSALACESGGGDYGGDLTECFEDACVPTACCHLVDEQGACELLSPVACMGDNGFALEGLSCQTPGLSCELVSCCAIDGSCEDDVFAAACAFPSLIDNSESCATRACDVRGACCIPGDNMCRIVSQTECFDLGGFYAGDQVECVEDFCRVGACCLNDGSCIDETLQACQLFGNYAGGGTTCQSAPCCQFAFTSSNPANCAIDGGMPGDGRGMALRAPWSVVSLEYSCEPEQVPSFTVSVVPEGDAPTVEQVDLLGTNVLVTLSDPIEPGKWTCLKQFGSSLEWCFGSLPADVNGNGTADTNDLTRLVEQLNGLAAPVPVYQCDANRTDQCVAPDIITVIDLLNGGWNSQNLPACPTAP